VEIAEITVDELDERRAQGGVVLDVRQPDEYEEGHVPGAVLIPLGEVPDRVAEVPDGDLYIICARGARSLKAAEFLATQGRVGTNVAGGTIAWVESGRSVVTGTEPG
jgi:rhodanese-related sulfurtransferase